MVTIVPVKDVPVGLSPHIRGRADFFVEVRHFGIAYYIPLSKELKRAFGVHVVKGQTILDYSRRNRDLEAILSDLVGSVFLQIRDTVGAGVKAELSRKMEESFSALFEKTISGAVDAKLLLPERRAIEVPEIG